MNCAGSGGHMPLISRLFVRRTIILEFSGYLLDPRRVDLLRGFLEPTRSTLHPAASPFFYSPCIETLEKIDRRHVFRGDLEWQR